MKIHQLSVFLENKPGCLSAPCRVLADAGINIHTLSLADTKQFGILRIIVRDWQKAKQVLEASGSVVNVAEVLAIEVHDVPGGMAGVLESIERAGLNIEYMYAFTIRRGDKAILVFRFENPEQAITALAKEGVNVVDSVSLYDLADNAG